MTEMIRTVGLTKYYGRRRGLAGLDLEVRPHEPELLVFDEPTIGLDPIMQQRFLELAAEARKAGQTTLISPFHLYQGGVPLQNGIQLGDLAVLAGASALMVIAGGLAFDRRDVAV